MHAGVATGATSGDTSASISQSAQTGSMAIATSTSIAGALIRTFQCEVGLKCAEIGRGFRSPRVLPPISHTPHPSPHPPSFSRPHSEAGNDTSVMGQVFQNQCQITPGLTCVYGTHSHYGARSAGTFTAESLRGALEQSRALLDAQATNATATSASFTQHGTALSVCPTNAPTLPLLNARAPCTYQYEFLLLPLILVCVHPLELVSFRGYGGHAPPRQMPPSTPLPRGAILPISRADVEWICSPQTWNNVQRIHLLLGCVQSSLDGTTADAYGQSRVTSLFSGHPLDDVPEESSYSESSSSLPPYPFAPWGPKAAKHAPLDGVLGPHPPQAPKRTPVDTGEGNMHVEAPKNVSDLNPVTVYATVQQQLQPPFGPPILPSSVGSVTTDASAPYAASTGQTSLQNPAFGASKSSMIVQPDSCSTIPFGTPTTVLTGAAERRTAAELRMINPPISASSLDSNAPNAQLPVPSPPSCTSPKNHYIPGLDPESLSTQQAASATKSVRESAANLPAVPGGGPRLQPQELLPAPLSSIQCMTASSTQCMTNSTVPTAPTLTKSQKLKIEQLIMHDGHASAATDSVSHSNKSTLATNAIRSLRKDLPTAAENPIPVSSPYRGVNEPGSSPLMPHSQGASGRPPKAPSSALTLDGPSQRMAVHRYAQYNLSFPPSSHSSCSGYGYGSQHSMTVQSSFLLEEVDGEVYCIF